METPDILPTEVFSVVYAYRDGKEYLWRGRSTPDGLYGTEKGCRTHALRSDGKMYKGTITWEPVE